MPDRILHYYGYDGEVELPEEGIADFNGRPHYFWLRQCIDQCTGRFGLAPADSELLAWAAEVETIWHQWDVEYHAGRVELNTHPMQPGKNPRFVGLMEKIQLRAQALSVTSLEAVGVVKVSAEFLEYCRQFVGRQWPVPGLYSATYEITWSAYHEV